jgi:hypothetical protein
MTRPCNGKSQIKKPKTQFLENCEQIIAFLARVVEDRACDFRAKLEGI